MESDRQGPRPIRGHVHTEQGGLRARSKIFSGLKILKGSYLGIRPARLKTHMGHFAYQSGRSKNSLCKFLGPKNFGRQFSWSPIGKAQGPYGAIRTPIRALYELGLEFSRSLKILKGNYPGARTAKLKAHMDPYTYRPGRSKSST